MNKEMFNKNTIMVLSYVSKTTPANKDCIASKIAKNLGLSIGSVFEVLKNLNKIGLVNGTRIGRAIIYEPVRSHPMMKSFRVFDNLSELNELVLSLKEYSRKIILFGSCSRGEDTLDSDIDLFVLADDDKQTQVRRLISEFDLDREIKPVIVDTHELMEMQSSDKVFYQEIMKGIELWGENNEYN